MPLSAGDRVGPYEITGELGAGMGIVLRARDTKLDRDVAIEVLPEAFTADPDRLARFDREAKVLASPRPDLTSDAGAQLPRATDAPARQAIRDAATRVDRLGPAASAAVPPPADIASSPSVSAASGLTPAGETGVPGLVIDGPPPPVPPAVIARDEAGRATLRAVRPGRRRRPGSAATWAGTSDSM